MVIQPALISAEAPAVPAVTQRALTGVAEAGDKAAGGSRGGPVPVAP